MITLRDYLITEGFDVVITREPGGLQAAEDIRTVILSKYQPEMDKTTEALLYAAARREHFIHVIQPALQQGKVVISDRYIDSSLVYQGIVRGLGIETVQRINQIAVENFLPSLTLLFDLDPEVGIRRVMENEDREKNRFDQSPISFHQKVREGYKTVSKMYSDRFRIIDANQSVNELKHDVHDTVIAHLKSTKNQKKML